uniref:Putative secreted protein n=1 Tax=Anopheles darlingi TaxID=43151 RepID=A0A2M4DG80_ANODA
MTIFFSCFSLLYVFFVIVRMFVLLAVSHSSSSFLFIRKLVNILSLYHITKRGKSIISFNSHFHGFGRFYSSYAV